MVAYPTLAVTATTFRWRVWNYYVAVSPTPATFIVMVAYPALAATATTLHYSH